MALYAHNNDGSATCTGIYKMSSQHLVYMYMLRPDSQPLAGFETGRPVSKPAGRFRSWLLGLYDEYME